jgi:hypothetical protein
MEMQFYPPGWVPWPTWQVAVGASSCDPTHWCAALNIDSLSLNPVTGQQNNAPCENQVGEEYVNFAFITRNGVAQGPANPVDATTQGTFTPDPSKDLFMNSGDHLRVSFTDTPDGVRVFIYDLSTHQFGSMTASAANGFAEVKYDPQRHRLHGDPVRLPSDVQHVDSRDARDMGRALVQHRVRLRDRSLPVLQRAGRDPRHAGRHRLERQRHDVSDRGHRGPGSSRAAGRRRRPLLFPRAGGAHLQGGRLHVHEHGLRRRVVPEALAGREHQTASDAVPVHEPRDRPELQRARAGKPPSKPTCRTSKPGSATEPRASTARSSP